MESIFHRTSIRTFQDKKVEQEKIDIMMRAAMAAPSAVNQQPWEFYIIENKELINKLSTCSPYATCLKNAPLAIVTCYKKEGLLTPIHAQIDLSIATEHILLAADSIGLGAVWLGVAPIEDIMDTVNQMISISDNLTSFAIIACGYPDEVKEQQDRYDESRIHYIK